jgi:hypothetical protein
MKFRGVQAAAIDKRALAELEKKDQMDVIEKILEHCKLWLEPVERAPPVKTAVNRFMFRSMSFSQVSDYRGKGRFVQISGNPNVFTASSDDFPDT